jgi:hypothetical protein
MANRRNTQRTPPRQRTPVQALEQRVDTWIASAGEVIGRLDRQQQILERAFMSLAGDIEYISADLGGLLAEGMLGGGGDELPESDEEGQQAWEDHEIAAVGALPTDVRVDPDNPAHEVALDEESPEEEAARLIAEAERLNEVDVTDAEAYYEGDR